MSGQRKTVTTRSVMLALTALACVAEPVAAAPAPTGIVPRAATDDRSIGRVTGLKLPRFVSLKSHEVRMRVGPSTDYAVRFVYLVSGLPLELLEEWGNWRLVRDQDGSSGWMHTAMLSGNRTSIVAPWLKGGVNLRNRPAADATIIARMQPDVLLRVNHCSGTWCHAALLKPHLSGYVAQANLWGVYPNEMVK